MNLLRANFGRLFEAEGGEGGGTPEEISDAAFDSLFTDDEPEAAEPETAEGEGEQPEAPEPVASGEQKNWFDEMPEEKRAVVLEEVKGVLASRDAEWTKVVQGQQKNFFESLRKTGLYDEYVKRVSAGGKPEPKAQGKQTEADPVQAEIVELKKWREQMTARERQSEIDRHKSEIMASVNGAIDSIAKSLPEDEKSFMRSNMIRMAHDDQRQNRGVKTWNEYASTVAKYMRANPDHAAAVAQSQAKVPPKVVPRGQTTTAKSKTEMLAAKESELIETLFE